jgi:trk system potassium uptake protein
MGEHIAKSLMSSGIEDQFTLSTGQIVAEIRPRADIVGKTLKDLQLINKYGVQIITIKRVKSRIDDRGEAVRDAVAISPPTAVDIVEDDDVLVAVGNQAQIERLARKD